MAKLYYQGHGSFRITAKDGTVIFVDPYTGDGYDVPADLILVTHQHSDHNRVDLVTQKPGCEVITNKEALAGKKHNEFDSHGVHIQAVEAKNIFHNPKKCVGYILTVDGVRIYAAGDTSTTEQMKSFAAMNLDYALLPIDGKFNMGPEEAAACARTIGAKHNIPIHMAPGKLFDRTKAEKFDAPNRIIVEPGQEIEL